MKKIFLSLISFFCVSVVFALDLGEMQIYSEPDEKLIAIIPIIDPPYDLKKLKVAFATKEEALEAGIAYSPAQEKLKFKVIKIQQGAQIHITNKEELDEEVMHFLIVLKSANSKLYREYVIIQNEDVYSAHAQPVIKETIIEKQKKHTAKHQYTAPTKSEISAQYIQVKNGDNLWFIAERLRKKYPEASFYQILAGLAKANPSAFIQNDINKLMAGKRLNLPKNESLMKLTPSQAVQYIEQRLHNPKYMQKPAVIPVEQKQELRILAPKTAEELTSKQEKLDHDLALVNESLEQVQRDNEGLQTRVHALQKQIDTLEELIALRKQKEKPANFIAEPTVQEPISESYTPGIKLSSSGWDAAKQLWQDINQNKWIYYLVLSLGILAILLVIISVYMIFRISQTDKAVKSLLVTSPIPVIKPSAAVKAKEKSPKVNKKIKAEGATSEEGDKNAIKLELAKAYHNLGDLNGAISLLNEILKEGNANQRKIAQELLEKWSVKS